MLRFLFVFLLMLNIGGAIAGTSCPVGSHKVWNEAECVSCGEPPDNSYYYKECNTRCNDGYEKQDGECVASAKQTACTAGISVLWAGTKSFPLYTECDSPALWVNISNGKCCANLESGTSSGAIHIKYDGKIYHTVN